MINYKSLLKKYTEVISDDNATMLALRKFLKDEKANDYTLVKMTPFNSETKYSTVLFTEGRYVLGAPEFIIKMLITLPFTNKSKKIINLRNIVATVIAFLISGISYFLAEYLIFGTWTALLDSVSGTMTALFASMSASLVQSGGSAIFFILFGIALDKSNIKQKLFHIE